MSKKKKWRTEELDALDDDFKTKKMDEYIKYLKVNNNSDEKLTFDEQEWIFNSIQSNYLINPEIEYWKPKIEFLKYDALEDARFNYYYTTCDYFFDIEGYEKHYFINLSKGALNENENLKTQAERIFNDEKFRTYLNPEENKEAVIFLENYYQKWKKEFENKNYSNNLLKICCTELKKQLHKEREKFLEEYNFGSNLWLRKVKEMFLIFRLAYLKSQSLFFKINEFNMQLWNVEIKFDAESYFHIYRHLYRFSKPDLLGKSYFKQDFMPDNCVELLKDIFQKISNKIATFNFEEGKSSIFFELNGIVYELWINKKNSVLRLSSLFPAKKPKSISKYKKKDKIRLDENLYYFS